MSVNNLRLITGASSYHEELTGDVEFCYLDLTQAQVRRAVERMNFVRAAINSDRQLVKAVYGDAWSLRFIGDGDSLAELRDADTGERFDDIRTEIEDIETGRLFYPEASEVIDEGLLDGADDRESVVYADSIIFKGEPREFDFFVGTPTIPREVFEGYLAGLPLESAATA